MDGDLARMKQWLCPGGHVLGVVQRTKVNGREGRSYHVSRLMLFRQAVDLSVEAGDVDVMAVVEGTTLDVRCSVCGEARTWWMGADAMERLVEKCKI